MHELYLAQYFNEMENSNDADVIVISNEENQVDAFKKFFKKTYQYEINTEHIIGIYQISSAWDSAGGEYEIGLTPR